MKRTLVTMVFLVVAATCMFAGGIRGADPLSGTWYGGSTNPDHAGYKYQYTFVPTGTNRWYAMADGMYSPDTFGAALLSKWTGEVHRSGDVYEIRLLAMTTNDPVDPPDELPTIHVVRGWITFNSENEITTEYDLWGIYAWGTTPLIDEPAVWALEPNSTITEVLHRMRMDVELP